MKICSYVVCTVHLYLYIVQYYTYATNHKTEILMIDHIAYLLWKNELTIRSPSGLIASSGMRRKSSRLRLHTTYTYAMIKWIVRRRSIGSEWHEVIDHRTRVQNSISGGAAHLRYPLWLLSRDTKRLYSLTIWLRVTVFDKHMILHK